MANETLRSEQESNNENVAQSQRDQEQLVDATTLLALLWDQSSRPSLRWLREQQARRTIPYVKMGARVWFLPSEVKRYLKEKWTVRRR